MPEHSIKETASGFGAGDVDTCSGWPTPTATQARSEGMIHQMRAMVDAGKVSVEEAEEMIQGSLTPHRMMQWPAPRANECGQRNSKDKYVALSKVIQDKDKVLFPTARTRLVGPVKQYKYKGQHRHGKLEEEVAAQDPSATGVVFPTPVARDGKDCAAPSQYNRHSASLPTYVTLWPTPRNCTAMTARITKDAVDGAKKRCPNLETVVARCDDKVVNRYLNPTWVEVLMGWPRGWSKIRPLDPDEWERWQHDIFSLWRDGVSWEAGLKRVTTRKRHRVQRLKAIGNGQVPNCVVLAVVILSAHAQDDSSPLSIWNNL